MLTSKRLFDVLTRHQVYLEGVKDFYSRDFNNVLSNLYTELKIIFSRIEYDNLDALTKRELKNLILEVRELQRSVYNSYFEKIAKDVENFVYADRKLSVDIFESLLEKPLLEARKEFKKEEEPEDDNNILPLSYFEKENEKKLWVNVRNVIVPANGLLIMDMFDEFFNRSAFYIENSINIGYSNKLSTNETLRLISGSKSNKWKDGVFSKMNRDFTANTHTMFQQVSSVLQAGLSSLFFKKYEWVSVLDSKTSEICRFRDNKIYEYGKGPLPPAHYRCRSKTIPVIKGDPVNEIDNFRDWIIRQPRSVQKDILSARNYKSLRENTLKNSDLKKFETDKVLSISDFSDKKNLILEN